MLIDNFYNIQSIHDVDNSIYFRIKLNPTHDVYKGHFPSQAVVPGVVQLQIIKELLEGHLKLSLFMGNISQVKYLRPILPDQNTELTFTINIKNHNSENIKSVILISFEEIIFTKANIVFNIKK